MPPAIDHDAILFVTGSTPDGTPLVGGVWKLWEQEGFPLEMAWLECRARGYAVDWLEAMADASTTHNLPALMKHIEAFLPGETLLLLKLLFMEALRRGKSYEQIVTEKRANSRALVN